MDEQDYRTYELETTAPNLPPFDSTEEEEYADTQEPTNNAINKNIGKHYKQTPWSTRYEQLIEYKTQHGSTNVPNGYTPNPPLAKWVSKQRQLYASQKLSQDRIQALNSIGFEWTLPRGHPKPTDVAVWNAHYQDLLEYKRQFRHVAVPKRYSHNKLGMWVHVQRRAYNNNTLSEERILRLNEVGFVWDPRRRRTSEAVEEEWEERYAELLEYKEEKGDCNVPTKGFGNVDLMNWVKRQRHHFKIGTISPEHIVKLNEIGFAWHLTNLQGTPWQTNYDELVAYKNQHGDCDVKASANPQLRKWILMMRKKYGEGLISKEKIDLLNDVGFVWNEKEKKSHDDWERFYPQLVLHKEQFGCHVSNKEENPQLSAWIAQLRKSHAAGKLSQERIDSLNDIGFIWNAKEAKSTAEWEKHYPELLQYKQQFGNCNVPFNYKENPRLGAWVCYLRRNYNANKLSTVQVSKLEEIGFDWTPPLQRKKSARKAAVGKKPSHAAATNIDPEWLSHYQQLVEFKDEFGDCHVPEDDSDPLSSWVRTVRADYKAGKLKSCQIYMLQGVGFVLEGDDVLPSKEDSEGADGLSVDKATCEVDGAAKDPTTANADDSTMCIDTVAENAAEDAPNQKRAESATKAPHPNVPPADTNKPCSSDSQPLAIQEGIDSEWMSYYNKLVEFKDEFGNCNVPDDDSDPLSRWVHAVRANYKEGKLLSCQIYMLDEVGFVWEEDEALVSTEGKATVAGPTEGGDVERADVADATKIRLGAVDEKEHAVVVVPGAPLAAQPTREEATCGHGFDGGIAVASDAKTSASHKDGKNIEDNLRQQIRRYWQAKEEQATATRAHGFSGGIAGASAAKTSASHKDDKLEETGMQTKKKESSSAAWVWPGERRTNSSWDQRFEELKKFKRKFGTTKVPVTYKDNPQLGRFVQSQRAAYKAGKLSGIRLSKLKRIGFIWAVTSAKKSKDAARKISDTKSMNETGEGNVVLNGRFARAWTAHYQELIRYKEEFGNCLVPQHYTANPGLGRFVMRQRAMFRAGKLSDDRTAKLNDIGFVWAVNAAKKSEVAAKKMSGTKSVTDTVEGNIAVNGRGAHAWTARYHELIKYKEEFGNCLVPQHYTGIPGLGRFVLHQRVMFKAGKLPADRTAKLNEIGFVWVAKNGVPVSKMSDTKSLAETVDDGATNARGSDAWTARYQELIKYKEEFGNCLVPQHYTAIPGLGGFVFRQRVMFKAGKLSVDRITKLNELGFVWEAKKGSTWTDNYNKLLAYKEKFGTCNVSVKEDLPLYRWAVSQRKRAKKGTLRAGQSDKLNDIGFEWSRPKGNKEQPAKWDARYNELKLYKDEFGHCRVPNTFPPNQKLSNWVHAQKDFFRRNKLSDKRIALLNEIGFEWNEIDRSEFWDTKFNELVQFQLEFGHCNVPKQYKPNIQLGAWACKLRHRFKIGKLTNEQIDALNELGFVWAITDSISNAVAWDRRFRELKQHHAQFGNCRVSWRKNSTLAQWIQKQRKRYKKGSLPANRIAKLESIGFVWEVMIDWSTHYNELVEYKQEFGDCNVPIDYSENEKLGRWVHSQRDAINSGKIKQDRLEKLNAIDFV